MGDKNKLSIEELEQLISDQEEYLNSRDEHGDYTFFHYLSEMNQAGAGLDTPLQAIMDIDLDTIDFNMGHEQGFLQGIKYVLKTLEDKGGEVRRCSTCSTSMMSGYVYEDSTYCSDECLPISVEQFNQEYKDCEDEETGLGGENYWTQWESIYLD